MMEIYIPFVIIINEFKIWKFNENNSEQFRMNWLRWTNFNILLVLFALLLMYKTLFYKVKWDEIEYTNQSI